jgi:regulator of protease activity HflC (stomatin/prohibitin superfamily)
MFVAITHHPNRGEWRSLFATEAEARADADSFLAMFPGVAVTARVEAATADDAAEYIERSDEAESEARAEYGSGAVSLGYDGSEAMAHYDGYRAADNALYATAVRYLAALRPITPAPPASPVSPDDIPF